jgi:hypothetical protein
VWVFKPDGTTGETESIRDLVLHSQKPVAFEWVYQPNGTRSFSAGTTQGTAALLSCVEGDCDSCGFLFASETVTGSVADLYFGDWEEHPYGFWANNGTGGVVDMGSVSLGSVSDAPTAGYDDQYTPVVVGHTYCVLSRDGASYAKLRVTETGGQPTGFSDDMESGQKWTATGLWHLTTKRSGSPTHSQWFGDETTGTYGPGSAPTSTMSRPEPAGNVPMATAIGYGELTSPSIPVAGRTAATLSFWHWRQVEYYAGSYDKTYVQVKYGSGGWQTVWSLDSSTRSSKTWEQVSRSLSIPSDASSLQVRFVFDSVDAYANNYAGWFIDDVALSTDGPDRVAAVTFSPLPSTYSARIYVTLSCATPGATIHYTTDGTDPTAISSVYSAPITVSFTTTVKARAYKTGLADSVTVSHTYVIGFSDDMESDQKWTATGLWHLTTKRSNSPTHSRWFGDETTGTYGPGSAPTSTMSRPEPAGNAPMATGVAHGELTSPSIPVAGRTAATLSFRHWRDVEYSARGSYDKTYVQVKYGSGGWHTVWSLDSSTPSSRAWEQVNQSLLRIPSGVSSLQVRFVFDSVDGYNNNYAGWFIDDVDVALTTSELDKVAAAIFSPLPSTYSAPISVTLSCATPGATVRYTTDGTDPTTSSSLYSSPIPVTVTTTIKARAYKTGLADSDLATGAYAIQGDGFSDDMESGQRWTATGLWHLTTKMSSSPTHSQWFGDETTGTYGPGSAPASVMSRLEASANAPMATGAVHGELASPSIAVTDGTTATLSFRHWRDVEYSAGGSYDKTYVQARYDGGMWQTLWSLDSMTVSSKTWQQVSLGLSVPGGASSLQVRFVFDSVDAYANAFRGWFVDDVEVYTVSALGVCSNATENLQPRVTVRPNPIQDVSTGTFTVDGVDAGAIRIEIYDLGGGLVFQAETTGSELLWHTDSIAGDYLANGVYLYRAWALVDGQWIACGTGKVVILR